MGIDFSVRHALVMPGFYKLEKKESFQRVASVVSAIQREAYHIGRLASDWAAWDDTYQFVQDGNEAYIKSNFQWESLNSSGIDLIYICRLDGKVVWGGIYDPILKKNITLKQFPEKSFPKNDFLLHFYQTSKNPWGIVLTEKGPMLITCQPILTSANTGPSHGVLIMGRFLVDAMIKELEKQTKVTFSIKNLKTSNLTSKEKGILSRLATQKYIEEILNNNRLEVFSEVPDIQHKPALLVSALFNRDIVTNGRATATLTSFSFMASFVVMVFFVTIWFVLFKKESLKRQQKISNLVQKRTRELKESEKQLLTLINATPDIICFKDGEGRWLQANQADLDFFHLNGVEYRGKIDSELAGYTHPIFKKAFLQCEDTDEHTWQKGTLTRHEESITTPGGIIRILDVIKVPVFHKDGRRKGLIIFGRDITQEKKLADKLQKAEKMQAIGLMAGGVAHDLNNILSGIIAYPDLILMQLDDESELIEPILAIQEAGKRAADVVADLLTIARGVAAPRQPSNLNTLIRQYLDSPEHAKIQKMYPNIQVKTEFQADLSNIICSPVHITKCLMNLINNAFEAIGSYGLITISTWNQHINGQEAARGHMEEGKYSVVAITDTGPGIPEKDIEHIFDPFYTKKVMGKSGTGLGLAIVWNAMHDHEGSVEVSSSDTGTVFTLFFPCTAEDIAAEEDSMDLEILHGHQETILVVDDEAPQRNLADKLLSSLGYTVHTVCSGEDALQYLRGNKVDLVLLDMILGSGMGGRQTYEKIIEIRPDQKALIVSGYCEDQEVKAIQKSGKVNFVRKPYTLLKIGIVVKQALMDKNIARPALINPS